MALSSRAVWPASSRSSRSTDHTVDFVTEQANASLNADWDVWYIMDPEWAVANDTVAPTSIADPIGSFAHTNANGSGS